MYKKRNGISSTIVKWNFQKYLIDENFVITPEAKALNEIKDQ